MNKTRVDNILLEMISPKIKEIEEKFSRGEGLDENDVQLLLLKSQFNHINHLDDKLNEVTASVVNLEHKFEKLEQKVNIDIARLEEKLDTNIARLEEKLDTNIARLEEKLDTNIARLEEKIDSNKIELEEKFHTLEEKFHTLEQKFETFKEEMRGMFEKSQKEMLATINNTMKWYIGGAGVILVVLKMLDIFVK
jgi:flagellar capping protein FliD